MAKSLRSKSKRSYRAKKREAGKYAAAEAARLQRLNAKLVVVKSQERLPGDDAEEEGTIAIEEEEENQRKGAVPMAIEEGGGMAVDETKRSDERPVSTHGPRGSRREEWRKSKGMVPVPKRQGTNRQGVLAGRRKAGRPSRRR